MDEHDYFQVAAAVNALLEIAHKHDGEGLIQAESYLDMSPSTLLRGMSFLGECLDAYDDPPRQQAKIARVAIREVTALCAVLMEMGCMAGYHRQKVEPL